MIERLLTASLYRPSLGSLGRSSGFVVSISKETFTGSPTAKGPEAIAESTKSIVPVKLTPMVAAPAGAAETRRRTSSRPVKRMCPPSRTRLTPWVAGRCSCSWRTRPSHTPMSVSAGRFVPTAGAAKRREGIGARAAATPDARQTSAAIRSDVSPAGEYACADLRPNSAHRRRGSTSAAGRATRAETGTDAADTRTVNPFSNRRAKPSPWSKSSSVKSVGSGSSLKTRPIASYPWMTQKTGDQPSAGIGPFRQHDTSIRNSSRGLLP